jgi:hypothetical protein
MLLAIKAASLLRLNRGFDIADELFPLAGCDCLASNVFSEKVIIGKYPQAMAHCL